MKANSSTGFGLRLQRRRSRGTLLVSVALHALAAWGAACLILHIREPAPVAAGGGDEAGDDGGPVAFSHVAPPVRPAAVAVPRLFPDKTPLLRSTGPSPVSLPEASLVFRPAIPSPVSPEEVASSAAPVSREKSARHAGSGKGKGGRGGKAGSRGDGQGMGVASAPPPAPPTSPVLLRSTAPEYPSAARSRGAHGTVWVRVTVTPGGSVDDASVQRSCGHGDLDAAAVRTARRWTFAPATAGGRPVRAAALVKVNFVLR